MLREPPSALVAGVLDQETTYIRADATIHEVAAHVAYYNLTAAPVVESTATPIRLSRICSAVSPAIFPMAECAARQ